MRTRLSPFSCTSETAEQEIRIVQAAPLRFLQVVVVDQIDDLQMPRQQPAEQLDRPAFQRFRQQRVVGVAQRGARDRPGLLPGEVVVVHQDPHQLGDRDRRMRVVELHRGVIGEIVERGEFVEMPAAPGPAARPT